MNHNYSDDESQFHMISPQYMAHKDRLSTYKKKWPQSLKYLAESLCEAGFYYTQKGDEVQCFCCGGTLKNWNDCEQPWEQHAIWMPKCDFINMVKGATFINNAKEKVVIRV